jgi:hypothetical protein
MLKNRENDAIPAAFFSAMNENVMSTIRVAEKAKRITACCSIVSFS